MGTVLVVGASGVVGSAVAERFLAEDDREVVTVSRREPEIEAARPYRHVAVDLRDGEAARAALAELDDVDDIVYTALFEKPGVMEGWTETDQMETNLAMLRNVLEPVLAASPGLQHVSMLQGTKAYGVHLHPITIPARERQPRDPHENFYWLQEDLLAAEARRHGFSWSIFRPQLIVGSTLNTPMNMIPVIGAYAAICRAEGLPFSYPGGGDWVFQTSDSRIVAGAIQWASRAPEARNEVFNITNGEVCEWHELWPSIAATVGLEPGEPNSMQLSAFLPEHADTWDRIVAEQGLRPNSLSELVGESHHYSDFIFAHGAEEIPPTLVSDVKIRAAGFTEVMDTEETFDYWLNLLAERNILPTVPDPKAR
jgi:nucleoside-diphosphate-sugar epimerase